MLVVTTTHLKEAYIRRSGLMRSDQATVRTRWRMIGDYLQATVDPVRPGLPGGAVRPQHDDVAPTIPAMLLPPYPCEEATETGDSARQRGALPARQERAAWTRIRISPIASARLRKRRLGGPATMYPEFIAKMKTMPVPERRIRPGEGGN